MSKKVLVLYYSQSGQLDEVVNCFVGPFVETGVSVEKVRMRPQKDFDFPWTSDRFFDAMPESVLAKPIPLQPFEFKESHYDLVIFGYQPWYLSLSIPANSILSDPSVKRILKDTPVVTLIAARNMWLNAQEKTKAILKEAGAKLVGNIALVDRNGNITSAITILYWMLTGKKESYLGVFPKPGVAAADIQNSKVFGKTVSDYLLKGNFDGLQSALVAEDAVRINPNLMFVEERAGRLFNIWANLVNSRKNRNLWITIYKYYLLVALFIVAPIVLAINTVFFQPFFGKSIMKKTRYYSGLAD